MPLYDWIHSNLHDLNLDWIIKKIKNVETAEANSAASAADANAAKVAAAGSATAANNSKTAAAGSATAAAASAQTAQNLVDQLDTTIAADVETWLNTHVTPTSPIVDDTLTIQGAAADAKKTGDEITDLKTEINLSRTKNLFDPINKSGTVDGVTYDFKNGVMHMSGTKNGWIIFQNITGTVGDKMALSSMARSAKPPIYIRNGSTNVATLAGADGYVQFEMPVSTVQLSAYVSGTFDYTFALTLVKNEIPSFPLLLLEDGENTIKNFSDCTYEAIGDSLTYGFTGSWSEGQQVRVNTPYPDEVKSILGFKTAVNKGETGTTIANDTETMGTYQPISSDSRLAGYSYAQVISVMGGTNDFTLGTQLGTVYDTENMSTFHAGWKRILSRLTGIWGAYDPFVFVIIPPVTQSLWTDNSVGYKWVDYINATLEECRRYGVPVLDMSVMGRLSASNKNYYTSDGIHFNQWYISRIFAPMVADFIKRNCH